MTLTRPTSACTSKFALYERTDTAARRLICRNHRKQYNSEPQPRQRGVQRKCENSDQISHKPRQRLQGNRPRPVEIHTGQASEISPSPRSRTTYNAGPCKPLGIPVSQPTVCVTSGIKRTLHLAFFTAAGIISPHAPRVHNWNSKGTRLPAEAPL